MFVNMLKMKNWASFYGQHTIDLTGGKKQNVTIIHGTTGIGKTSITSAFQWVISGETHEYTQVDTIRTRIIRKMIMFDKPKKKGSLLNLEAFEEGKWDLSVSINFNHQNETFELTRRSRVHGNKFKSDEDVETKLTLKQITGFSKTWEMEDAQKMINSMMPERILKFFIVEGDFITKYTEVLFNSDNNFGMTDAVRDAIGVNAIQKSAISFKTLKQRNADELNVRVQKLQNDKGNITKAKNLMEKIKKLESRILNIDVEIAPLEIELKRVEGELESYTGIKLLFDSRDEIIEEIDGNEQAIEDSTEEIITEVGDLWRMVLTPTIKIKRKNNSGNEPQMEKNEEKIMELRKKIDEGKKRQIYCKCCNQKLPEPIEALSDTDLKKLNNDCKNYIRDNKKINKNIRLIKNIESAMIDDYDTKIMKSYFEKFINAKIDCRENNRRLSRVQRQLANSGNISDNADTAYLKLTTNRIECNKKLEELNNEKKWIEEGKGKDKHNHGTHLVLLRKSLSNLGDVEGKGSKSSKIVEKYEKYGKKLQLLQDAFEKAENLYLKTQHDIIDENMTRTFRKMITSEEQKRTHDHLTTTDGWAVECWTVNDDEQMITNPGTQRKATLAYLEALRNRSGIEFPIVFDNAQGALEQEAKDELAEHFIRHSNKQTIILSHSGGYNLESLIKNFNQSINRVYELKQIPAGKKLRAEAILRG
jgi:DNA sulfur modification protein DndD